MSIEAATTIADLVRHHGGRALVVGGWVRDRLLGRTGKDVDVEVYGLAAPQLKALLETLGPVNTVGESFTVYKVLDVDVSLPRRESKTGRGHRGFDRCIRVVASHRIDEQLMKPMSATQAVQLLQQVAKLPFAPAQRFLKPLPLTYIARDLGRSNDSPAPIFNRRNGDGNIKCCSVLP